MDVVNSRPLYNYDKYNYVYNKSIIYSSIYSHLVGETVARLEYMSTASRRCGEFSARNSGQTRTHANGEQALRRLANND